MLFLRTCSAELGHLRHLQSRKKRRNPNPRGCAHFIWAHFHRLPALSSAPGSLHQCYHLLYLLKVHKSLVSKLGKWLLSPRAAGKAAKGSESEDVGFQTTQPWSIQTAQKMFLRMSHPLFVQVQTPDPQNSNLSGKPGWGSV